MMDKRRYTLLVFCRPLQPPERPMRDKGRLSPLLVHFFTQRGATMYRWRPLLFAAATVVTPTDKRLTLHHTLASADK